MITIQKRGRLSESLNAAEALQYRVSAADGKVRRLFRLHDRTRAVAWAETKARQYDAPSVVEIGHYDGGWILEAVDCVVGPSQLYEFEKASGQ